MKKILAAVLTLGCMLSASAVSLGFRGDVDIGVGQMRKGDVPASFDKAKQITGGDIGLWVDLPFIDLKFFTLGVRPELELAFNQGIILNNETQDAIRTTDLTIPVYLDASFNIAAVRISGGVGPYLSIPLSVRDTGARLGSTTIKVPSAGWDLRTWGLGAYVQGGFKLGPGYLLAELRANSPFTEQEFKDSSSNLTVINNKRYRIDAGLAYEFKFKK